MYFVLRLVSDRANGAIDVSSPTTARNSAAAHPHSVSQAA